MTLQEVLSTTEDELIDAIRSNIDYFKTVSTIGEAIDNEVADFTILAPAVYVAMHKITTNSMCMNSGLLGVYVQWRLTIMTRHLDKTKIVRGGTSNTGIYQMMSDLISVIRNTRFTAFGGGLVFEGGDNIGGDESLAIYGVTFSGNVRVELS